MKKSRKVLPVFLSFIMVFSVFAAFPMEASAAAPVNPTATTTWDFTSVDANGNGSYGGGSWTWTQSSRTLSLTNFNLSTSAETAIILPSGSAITLNGTNSIRSTYNGVNETRGISTGAITINSTNNGIMTVTAGSINTGGESIGIRTTGMLTINGNVTVNAYGGSASTVTGTCQSYGIYANRLLLITGSAIVNAIGGITTVSGSGSAGSTGIQMRAPNYESCEIGGSARVNATGRTAVNSYSMGVSASGTLNINGNANVTATGGTASGSNPYSYGIHASFYLKGGSITMTGNNSATYDNYTVPMSFRYWTNATATSVGAVQGTGTGIASGTSATAITSAHKYARVEYVAPPTYTITYAGNGTGVTGVPAAVTKTHGVDIYLSHLTPSFAGYRFLGWSTNNSATTATYREGDPFTANANTTLYAVWIRAYTISYNINGGSGSVPAIQYLNQGSYVTLSSSPLPTRTGYTFLGWATNSSATAATHQPGGIYNTNADATLYAVWKKVNNDGSGPGTGKPGSGIGKPGPVVSVKTQSILYLVKGKKVTIPAAVQPFNAKNKAVTWKSSKPKIVKVDAKTGKVKALKTGSAKITVTTVDGKKVATCKVYVVKKAKKFKKFTITPGKATSIVAGKTLQVKTKLNPKKATGIIPTYKSSKTSVAVIDKAGVVTAVKQGTTTITVKAGKKTKKFVLTVK